MRKVSSQINAKHVLKLFICILGSQLSLTCVCGDITIGTFVLLQGKPGQVEAGDHLHRILLLPLVDQVVHGPAVCEAKPRSTLTME